jgi:hypothetical protein
MEKPPPHMHDPAQPQEEGRDDRGQRRGVKSGLPGLVPPLVVVLFVLVP